MRQAEYIPPFPATRVLTRRIVQASTAAGPVDQHRAPMIFALCNDGSLWRLLPYDEEGWTRLPDIPQDWAVAAVRWESTEPRERRMDGAV